MKILQSVKKFFEKTFFHPKWRCVCCGKEIFNEEAYCNECLQNLPYIKEKFCNHCGRQTIDNEEYCSTCKNILVSIDKSRSVFNYKPPINKLILKAKYHGDKYLLKIFAEELEKLYLKNEFKVDALCYVPMTKKAKRKRTYNQAEILCRELASKINFPVVDCLEKRIETQKQAKLDRAGRLKNLENAFFVTDRKAVKGKSLLLVDDVTTTGSTAEAVAYKLKKAGASKIYLLTVASVEPIDKY